MSGLVWLQTHSNWPIFSWSIYFSFSFNVKEWLLWEVDINTFDILFIKSFWSGNISLFCDLTFTPRKWKHSFSSLTIENDFQSFPKIAFTNKFLWVHRKSSAWTAINPIILLFSSCHINNARSNFKVFLLFSVTKSQTLEYHLSDASHNPYIHLFNFHVLLDGQPASGGGLINISWVKRLPYQNAVLISIDCNFQSLCARIKNKEQKLSLEHVGDSFSNFVRQSSSNPLASSQAFGIIPSGVCFVVNTHCEEIYYFPETWLSWLLADC